MASSSSIETLKAENSTLYQRLMLLASEVQELENRVERLQKSNNELARHVFMGTKPAPPKLFGEPQHLPGTGAAGGGCPPVEQSASSNVEGVDLTGCFPGLTFRDANGKLYVGLMPTVSYDDGMCYEAVTDGWVRYVKRKEQNETNE